MDSPTQNEALLRRLGVVPLIILLVIAFVMVVLFLVLFAPGVFLPLGVLALILVIRALLRGLL